jgi:hypothetical protein
VANAGRIVDCHAHIIDPARFPFTGTRGYKRVLADNPSRLSAFGD